MSRPPASPACTRAATSRAWPCSRWPRLPWHAFVESLALPSVDAQAVAATLVRRIGGNPLHLLETIRHSLEKHGHLRADQLEAPARVTELLEQRLLALPADGLLLVRIASVAGDQFDAGLAAAVSRRDVLELADAWHALERQGLLDSRGFMHDLIGEAAHRLLPRPIAQVLHGRVAIHLAQHGASAARLAHHLLSAGDEAAAVPHLASAARQAWQLGRSRETREAFFRAAAIELARGRPDAAFDLLFDCAESLTELGPLAALNEAVERMAPLVRTPSQQARVTLFRAIDLHKCGDDVGFLKLIDSALALAVTSEDRIVEGECRFAKGYYAAHDGRLGEAVQLLEQTAALQRSIGRETRALSVEMNTNLMRLWTGQARYALSELQALQQRLGSRSSQTLAMLLARVALCETHLGRFDAAGMTARRALEALRNTDMIGIDLAANIRIVADVQRRCGHWGEALAIIEELQPGLGPQGDPQQRLAETLAEIYLDLGRPELAHRHIEAFAAASQFSARTRQRTLLLRWGYALATSTGFATAAALEAAMHSENLLIGCELMLAAGRSLRSERDGGRLRPADRALRRQKVCTSSSARCTRCRPGCGLGEGNVPAAEANGARAEVLLGGDIAAVMPALCGLWLARASRALGQPADATRQAERAAAWLRQRAHSSVPAEFRDSFLQRNPVHAELLAGSA